MTAKTMKLILIFIFWKLVAFVREQGTDWNGTKTTVNMAEKR